MMNKRQQKEYDKINNFLAKFDAKIKEDEDYINKKHTITVVNMFNVEQKFTQQYLLSMHNKKKFWTFDGVMSDFQREELKKIKKIAENNGGKLLSTIYNNTLVKLEFEDAKSNKFFMTAKNLKRGQWSPYESNLIHCPDYHLKHLQEIAQSKGGKLISTKYINSKELMEFEDDEGNRFFQTSKSIKKGFWLPFQSFGISEEICRQCIEFIFKKKFPTNWKIIKRINKKNLQLDGYNKDLNFAFEYQGEQHYEENYNNKKCIKIKKTEFERLKENDIEKLNFCKNNNIKLFIIKFFNKCKKDIDYLNHVLKEIKKTYIDINNYLINLDIHGFKIDYAKIKRSNKHLSELREIAEKRGGKLLSKSYKGNRVKLEFEDKYGNIFLVSPVNIKGGKWSPFESNRVRDKQYHLNILKNIAIKNNGKLMSKDYINNRSKLEFENEYGMRFFMSSCSVKRGCWNNKNINYKKQDLSRELIKKIAHKKGLTINSNLINSDIKLEFIDQNKNKVYYTLSELKKVENINKSEYYLNILKEIAESKEGKLISTKYINNKTKLEFEDKNGNRFFDSPYNIKNNIWIPDNLNKVKNQKLSYLEELSNIAKSKEGKLISTQYINNFTKLEFEDKNGNRFLTTPEKIKNGVWSPYESGNARDSKYNLNKIKIIAENKGGKLISNEYVNNKTILEFEDENGNRFFRKASDIMRGRWNYFRNK